MGEELTEQQLAAVRRLQQALADAGEGVADLRASGGALVEAVAAANDAGVVLDYSVVDYAEAIGLSGPELLRQPASVVCDAVEGAVGRQEARLAELMDQGLDETR